VEALLVFLISMCGPRVICGAARASRPVCPDLYDDGLCGPDVCDGFCRQFLVRGVGHRNVSLCSSFKLPPEVV